MSTTSVFWPKAGIRRSQGLVLGLRLDNVVVVVAIVEKWVSTKWTWKLMLDGRPGSSVSRPDYCRISKDDSRLSNDESGTRGSPRERYPSENVVGYQARHKAKLNTSQSAQIILFDPPDPRRLRYLTTGHPENGNANSTLAAQDGYGLGSRRESAAGLDSVLPLVGLHLLRICNALIQFS
jgi:hypothetical protein